jgi:hypothetical protein
MTDEQINILADSEFKTTQLICAFYEEKIDPILESIININPSTKENALILSYTRMYLYFCSLAKLNHNRYFQTVNTVVRSMFELLLDLKCISKDETAEVAERYLDFPDVTKYKMAEDALSFIKAHPEKKLGAFITQDYIDSMQDWKNKFDQDNTIEKLKQKHGYKSLPMFWHGKRMYRFADDLGMLKEYMRIYPFYSWFTHSGPTGLRNFDERTRQVLSFFGHIEAHFIFLTATRIISDELHITKAYDQIESWLNDIENFPKMYAKEELMKQLTDET